MLRLPRIGEEHALWRNCCGGQTLEGLLACPDHHCDWDYLLLGLWIHRKSQACILVPDRQITTALHGSKEPSVMPGVLFRRVAAADPRDFS